MVRTADPTKLGTVRASIRQLGLEWEQFQSA